MKTSLALFGGLVALIVLNSCEKKESTATNASSQQTSPLEGILLAEAPAGAISISEAFANPTPGTPVTVTGEVMGRREPFIENRAMLVLGDPSRITPCNRRASDDCETPWDVCCDDPEVIKTSIATIQVLAADGRPLKEGLKGLGGIQELTTLTVVGQVALGSNAQNLIINATKIHVGPTDNFVSKNS